MLVYHRVPRASSIEKNNRTWNFQSPLEKLQNSIDISSGRKNEIQSIFQVKCLKNQSKFQSKIQVKIDKKRTLTRIFIV